MRTHGIVAVLASAGLFASSRALADETIAACANSYADAQVRQKEGKYLEAAKSAHACFKPACGDALPAECGRLYDAIQASIPSVVLSARDADGNDLVNVKVFADGTLVREKLDGNPLQLDPGVHVFRFEAENLPALQKSYTIAAGEKLRILSEVLGEKKRVARPVVVDPPPPPPPPPRVSPKTLRIAGTISGVLGLAGFGAFGALWVTGTNDYNSLSKSCKPNCSDDQVSSSKLKFTTSYVGLGVGIAGVATAATLFTLSYGSSNASVRVSPSVTGGRADFELRF